MVVSINPNSLARRNYLVNPPKRKKPVRIRPPSSILEDALPDGHRATHSRIGRDGEKRVCHVLNEIYGPGSAVIREGTKGRPDILLKDPVTLIEVKSTELMKRTKNSLGGAKTFASSWVLLTEYAKSRNMGRVMIIEFRHKKSYLYIWIPGKEVDKIVQEKIEAGVDVVHVDFRTALKIGEILIPNRMVLESRKTPQTSMDNYVKTGALE